MPQPFGIFFPIHTVLRLAGDADAENGKIDTTAPDQHRQTGQSKTVTAFLLQAKPRLSPSGARDPSVQAIRSSMTVSVENR